MKNITALFILCVAAALPSCLLAQPYFFVGPAGGDFFDEANWNDSADGTGNALPGDPLMDDTSNAIDVDLIIDGDNVVAAGQVDFGIGSLTMTAGSTFEVSGSGNDLDLNDDTTTSITDSTLIVDDFIQLGGSVSLSGANLTASDDINFLGQISVANSRVESTGDDIEFRDDATILSMTSSVFIASSLGTDGSFNQSVIMQTTFTAVDSTFIGGQLGIDGAVETNVTAIDSTFEFTGDMNNVFSSSSTGIHRVFLGGNSTLEADQIEDGILLALQDSAQATFIDDADDDDDDGQPDTWIITNALVRLDSPNASLTFLNDAEIDVRNRVFNGQVPTTYALAPETFFPSNWNGTDAVTLRIVPEPTSMLLLVVSLGLVATRRQRAA